MHRRRQVLFETSLCPAKLKCAYGFLSHDYICVFVSHDLSHDFVTHGAAARLPLTPPCADGRLFGHAPMGGSRQVFEQLLQAALHSNVLLVTALLLPWARGLKALRVDPLNLLVHRC